MDQVSSLFFNNPCNTVEMRWGKKLKTNVTIMTKSSVNFYHFFKKNQPNHTKIRVFVSESVLRASDYIVFCRAENDVDLVLSIWLIYFFSFCPRHFLI